LTEVVDHGAAVLWDVDVLTVGVVAKVEGLGGERGNLLVVAAAHGVVLLPMPGLAWDTTVHGRPVQERPEQTALTTGITLTTPDVWDKRVTPTTHPHMATVHE